MHDRRWREIELELRREEPVDDAAVDRILREVRRHRPGPARRLWYWLTRPRPVTLTPLRALGAAAAVVAAFLVLARPGEGPGNSPVAAAEAPAPAAQPVQFVLVAPEATHVALAGDFNDWNAGATPLRRTGEGGVWTVEVPLRSGRYRYVFIVDGTRWVPDAAAPRGPEDEFGPSSVVLVGGST